MVRPTLNENEWYKYLLKGEYKIWYLLLLHLIINFGEKKQTKI